MISKGLCKVSDVIRLDKKRAQKKAAMARGKTLCGSGFHKWEIVQQQRFDVKQGRLVTVSRCRRCGAEKTEAR